MLIEIAFDNKLLYEILINFGLPVLPELDSKIANSESNSVWNEFADFKTVNELYIRNDLYRLMNFKRDAKK